MTMEVMQMLAFALLEKNTNVIVPKQPTGRNKDEWGMAYEKAYVNNGTREVYANAYVSKVLQGELLTKVTHETNIVERDGDSEADYVNGCIVSDVAFYSLDSAENFLASIEFEELATEFMEVSVEEFESSGFWILGAMVRLHDLGKTKAKSKEVQQIVEKLADAGVTDMVMEVLGDKHLYDYIITQQFAS